MSLIVYFRDEISILRVAIDVLNIFQLSDENVCRILSQGNCAFRSFYKTQQNVISLLGRKPITYVFHLSAFPSSTVNIPICF